MSCSASTAKSNRDPRHGAQRGVLNTVLDLVADGATHLGIATDHVIESWRNDLYEGYKDGAGIDPELFAQFPEVEELLTLAGFEVWPQIEHEADDAMAAAAAQAAADDRVEQVVICTPDKDLAQCVTADGRVIQFDRRREIVYDRDGVIAKFGVPPESIPDYLGVVGDTADGFPGLPGWGEVGGCDPHPLWPYRPGTARRGRMGCQCAWCGKARADAPRTTRRCAPLSADRDR